LATVAQCSQVSSHHLLHVRRIVSELAAPQPWPQLNHLALIAVLFDQQSGVHL